MHAARTDQDDRFHDRLQDDRVRPRAGRQAVGTVTRGSRESAASVGSACYDAQPLPAEMTHYPAGYFLG